MAQTTILCVGGGFASMAFAKAATKRGWNVIIVDPKDFFAVTFASMRAVVKPDGNVAQRHLMAYKDIPGIGQFIQGRVVNLTKNMATLEGGRQISFDWCVVATGSTNGAGVYAQPQSLDIAGRRAELKATSGLIQAAKSIIVVGAGFVGVELAAEIVEAYAGKKVTLVASTSRLFEGKPAKLGATAAKWFKEHKVEIVYNEKVSKKDDKTVVLQSGQELSADLVIWAVGAKPNTEFLKATELAPALDGAGRVKVDLNLRVAGFPNFFALGDINDVKEEKLGYLANLQAELTVKNLAALLKAKDAKLTGWVPYNGTPGAFVTLGSGFGTGAMGNCVFPGWMVGMVKSKDLFVGKVRGQFGVKG